MVVPYIEENSTFKIYGNVYKLRFQKLDNPIRKIDGKTATLTSAIGKLFIKKADTGTYDASVSIVKQFKSRNNIKKIIFSTLKIIDVKLPRQYFVLSRKIKSFSYSGYQLFLDYLNRANYIGVNNDLEKIENDGLVLIGYNNYKKKFLLIDNDNKLTVYENNKYTKLNMDLYQFLDIDVDTLNVEHSTVKIFKSRIPVALLLTYYLGLTKLLDLLKAKYEIRDTTTLRMNKNQYGIRFNDKSIVIDKDYGLNDMILYGLVTVNKHLKKISINTVDNKKQFRDIFSIMDLPLLVINEIDLLEHLFIDPLTIVTLQNMKEPVNLPALLIRASELLLTDYSGHPNNADEMLLRGDERIASYLYKELVNSLRTYRNKKSFGRATLILDPYKIVKTLPSDSGTIIVNDVNPILALKDQEDTTYTGEGGRSKEAMVGISREFHESELGITSEATKDSSDVGVNVYTTSAPNFKSALGDSKKIT